MRVVLDGWKGTNNTSVAQEYFLLHAGGKARGGPAHASRPRAGRQQKMSWPPFFPEVVYDFTRVFDGGCVGRQQCPVRIINLVISIGDDEEVTRHGDRIITDAARLL